MSRVAMANQCRAQKPQEPSDEKIIHCQRAHGHDGPHSSGPHYKWRGDYHREKKA